ncbi:MAG: hypothetical protein A4E51_01022 [Methanosaeta sp. PtaU1.Bin055]|nr:MAG: hypothetical protein A4E51_01022 [Methanosaeta sp. PtaU1.Bin055]
MRLIDPVGATVVTVAFLMASYPRLLSSKRGKDPRSSPRLRDSSLAEEAMKPIASSAISTASFEA